MKESEFLKELLKEPSFSNLTIKEVSKMHNEYLSCIIKNLIRHKKLKLRNFSTIELINSKGCIKMLNGSYVKVPRKKRIKFKISKKLIQIINNS